MPATRFAQSSWARSPHPNNQAAHPFLVQSRVSVSWSWLPELQFQAVYNERPNFGDAFKIGIHGHYAQTVVQRGLSDQQVRDGDAMPHSVVMCEISLQAKCSVEDVNRRSNDLKTCVNVVLQGIVVGG